MGCWSLAQGLWLLLSCGHWVLTGTLPGYPVVVKCHGDPAALDLQVPPLYMFQQFRDEVNIEVANS